MSASISTASPMTRLMGKRPQSTSGFTCWMTTLAGGRSVILKAYHGALDGKTLWSGGRKWARKMLVRGEGDVGNGVFPSWDRRGTPLPQDPRSEEHTSELQSQS